MRGGNRNNYRGLRSFAGKTRAAFCLTALIPYLVGVHLFIEGKIDLTEIVLLFCALTLFLILAGFMLLRQSGDQLARLAMETRMAGNGNGAPIRFDNADIEMADIASHFNLLTDRMQASEKGLREQSTQLMTYARDLGQAYRHAREEERLRQKLSRYVGQGLVEKLAHAGTGIFENEKKKATVLFADIRGFTGIAEKMDVEDLIAMLNEFFDLMVEIVFRHHGILDKFVGDQLVAVFGLLSSGLGDENDAVQAALDMQAATQELMRRRREKNQETFGIGIGINTGVVIVGNVGSRSRMDYTVLGDCVNVGARMQQIASAGEIIVGLDTFRHIRKPALANQKIRVHVKNRQAPLTCYRIPREPSPPIR